MEVKARLCDVMLEKGLHAAGSAQCRALEAEQASLLASKAALETALGGGGGSPAQHLHASPGSASFGGAPLQQQQGQPSRFAGPSAPFAPPAAAASGGMQQQGAAAWNNNSSAPGPSQAAAGSSAPWDRLAPQPFQPHVPAAAAGPSGYGGAASNQWDNGGGGGGGYAWAETGAGGFGGASEPVPDPGMRQGLAAAEGVEEVVECRQTEGASDSQWEKDFVWSEDMARLNEEFFANTGFRPNQRQAINATMAGKDVFVLMPTGGGARPVMPCHMLSCYSCRNPLYMQLLIAVNLSTVACTVMANF